MLGRNHRRREGVGKQEIAGVVPDEVIVNSFIIIKEINGVFVSLGRVFQKLGFPQKECAHPQTNEMI